MAQNALLRISPQLFTKEIQDILVRTNFQNLSDYFVAQNQLFGFQFLEMVFTGAVTNQAISHDLGVIPQDIIVTKITGVGSLTFNHGAFTTTKMFVSTSGACRVRFFYGTYWNFQSSVNNASTDATTYFAAAAGLGRQLLSPVSVPLNSTQTTAGTYGASSLTTYAMVTTDDIVNVNIGNSAAFTVTLPAVSVMSGRVVTLIKTSDDFKTVTIKTNSTSELFTTGSTSTVLSTKDEKVQLFCDGTTWRVLYRDYPKGVRSYTPTLVGFGTPTGVSAYWWRVGDKIYVDGAFTAGTTTSAIGAFSLPSGLVMDNSKMAQTSPLSSYLGVGIRNLAGGIDTDFSVLGTGGLSNINFSIVNGTSSPAVPLTPQQASSLLNAGELLTFSAHVPIVGWEA